MIKIFKNIFKRKTQLSSCGHSKWFLDMNGNCTFIINYTDRAIFCGKDEIPLIGTKFG